MNLVSSLFRNVRALTMEDPAQPLQPMSVLMDMLGMTITDSGLLVNEKTAMRQPTVAACIRVKSQGLASLPLLIFKREKQGKTQSPGHRLFQVLHDQPNDTMTSMAWREGAEAQRWLWGNAYTEIQRDAAQRPKYLWPLPSDRTRAERKNGMVYYITTATPSGSERIINARDMIHVPALAFDGLSGISPIQIGKQTIGRALAMERFGSQYFGNGSRPSGVFTYKGGALDDESRANLQKSLKSATSQANALNSLLLEGDLEWKPMTIPNNEAQFVEAMKEIVADIARLFGVPLHLVQDLNRSTNNNIEQQALEHIMYGLRPDAIKWEQELNRKLFPDGEYFCEHSMEGLLRGDFKTRMEGYAKLFGVGGLSPNMMAELENWNPLPAGQGGDLRFVPMNMVPLEGVQKSLDEGGTGVPGSEDTGDQGTPEDPTDPADNPDEGTPADPKGQDRRLIRAAVLGFAIDAVNRTLSRDKRDQRTVARIWRPVYQHAGEMVLAFEPDKRGFAPLLELLASRCADTLWTRTGAWAKGREAEIATAETTLITEMMIAELNGDPDHETPPN